jgi:NAD(P)-dependent dehydrogenase (short-subunit alcohol dehydrogenase family)
MSKPFAIVTGASSGIGLELAAIWAEQHRRMAEPGSAAKDHE